MTGMAYSSLLTWLGTHNTTHIPHHASRNHISTLSLLPVQISTSRHHDEVNHTCFSDKSRRISVFVLQFHINDCSHSDQQILLWQGWLWLSRNTLQYSLRDHMARMWSTSASWLFWEIIQLSWSFWWFELRRFNPGRGTCWTTQQHITAAQLSRLLPNIQIAR